MISNGKDQAKKLHKYVISIAKTCSNKYLKATDPNSWICTFRRFIFFKIAKVAIPFAYPSCTTRLHRGNRVCNPKLKWPCLPKCASKQQIKAFYMEGYPKPVKISSNTITDGPKPNVLPGIPLEKYMYWPQWYQTWLCTALVSLKPQ